jgi:hypothetical protein
MRTDVVLVKLGAALIVVTAVGNFQTYLSLILGKHWWIPTALIALLFAVALPVLMAYAFWKFPNTVVGLLEADVGTENSQSITPNELMLTGVSLIGLYTLVFGLVDLVHTETMRVTFVRHLRMMSMPETTTSPDADAQRYAGIARVVFGSMLLTGRHKIAGILQGRKT